MSGQKYVLKPSVSGVSSVTSRPVAKRSSKQPPQACGLKYQLEGLPTSQSSTSVNVLVCVLTDGLLGGLSSEMVVGITPALPVVGHLGLLPEVLPKQLSLAAL